MHDDFNRIYGWWSGMGSVVQLSNGALIPVSASTGSAVTNLLIPPATPTGAQVMTIEAVFSAFFDPTFNYTGAVGVGGVGFSHFAGIGEKFGVGNVFFIQNTSVGDVFQLVIGNNPSYTVKVECSTTDIKTYLDGVLEHTRVVVADPQLVAPTVRVSRIGVGAGVAHVSCEDYKIFGVGLPVAC